MAEISTETPVLKQMLAHLKQMTDAEVAEMRVLLGMDKPAPKHISPLEAGQKPDVEDYLLTVHDIDYDTCLARSIDGSDSCRDTRWSPAVYREYQCRKPVKEGCDICDACQKQLDKYAEKPAPGRWVGLITEPPLGWMHMLGTEWAESALERGKLKWTGIGNNPFSP
jgi:hypothetical protein